MGVKLGVGFVVAVIAATSIEVPVVLADETGLASMHDWRRERGKTCMRDHWHYGSSGAHRSKKRARLAAIRSWQNFTAWEYGSDWARFYRSGSRKIRCSRSSAGWSCDVEGRPCRRR